jgi:hypothetical protein
MHMMSFIRTTRACMLGESLYHIDILVFRTVTGAAGYGGRPTVDP